MKVLKRISALLVCACLLLTGVSAHAEQRSAAARGLELIRTAANWRTLILPQEESYLDEWKTLYPRRAWHAPSLQVEILPRTDTGLDRAPFVCEGTEVTVVAEENDMSLIVYRTPRFKTCAGWIPSIRLLEEFPGETLRIGTAPEGEGVTLHETELRWSDSPCPYTMRTYTELEEPLDGCTGFVLEYQIIASYATRRDAMLGERTVYVKNGRKWIEAGSFSYTELGAVRVEVRLESPVELRAVAVGDGTRMPATYEIRQTLHDFILSDAK